jgi:arsenate reductase
MKRVLFACAHNSGRSQMAAAFFNAFCAPILVKAVSAGTSSAVRVQPEVLEAMDEIGFDVGIARHQLLTPELVKSADLLVTFAGCGLGEAMNGKRRIEWSLANTDEQPLDQVRRIRDELRGRIWRLIAKEGWYKLQPASAMRAWAEQAGT